jgi:HAE1 family hydrophobic/amphiphilic exporter-1
VSHQGQFPAVTLTFNLQPGVALGEAIDAITEASGEIGMPSSVIPTFQGNAQAFQQSLSSTPVLIAAALVVVYIILGMLYESFIHPLTILSTLPSAGVGALLALNLGHMDLSVIGIIGIILLIGIVKKNGIMLVDFAITAERDRHLPPVEAIREACLLRFRPILMTTMAAMLAGVPLALGHGTGSGAAPTAWLCHGWRAGAKPAVDALYDAGRLSLPRSPAELAHRGRKRGAALTEISEPSIAAE